MMFIGLYNPKPSKISKIYNPSTISEMHVLATLIIFSAKAHALLLFGAQMGLYGNFDSSKIESIFEGIYLK